MTQLRNRSRHLASAPKFSRTRRPSTATSATSSASTRASASTARTSDRRLGRRPHLLPRRQRPRQRLHRRRHRPERRLRPQRHRLLVAQLDPDPLRRGSRDPGPVRAVRRRIWPVHRLRDQRRHQVGHQPVPRRRLLRIFGQRPARRLSRRPPGRPDRARQALGRLARRPDHQGPPVLLRRLRASGRRPVAGRRPGRRRLRQRDAAASPVDQFNADLGHPEQRLRHRTGPLGQQPAVQERPLFRPRSTGRSPTITGSKLTYQQLEEATRPHRRLLHRQSRRRSPASTPSTSAAPTPTIIRAASTRTGPTISRPSCATRAPRSRISRTRSAAAKRSPPTRSRASSSASTTRWRARHRRRPSSPARAPRARPTTCRPRSSSIKRGRQSRRWRPQLKVGAELNQADIFNLFVQNATGTLVFRNIADLRSRPAVARHSATTRPTPRPFNVVQRPDRRRVRQLLVDRRHQRRRGGVQAHHLFRLSAGRLARQRPAERRARPARRLVRRRQPDAQSQFRRRATASATTPGFNDIDADPAAAHRLRPTTSTISASSVAFQAARRRRHLLGRRSAGLVRQRLPEQRLRHRPGHDRRPRSCPPRTRSTSSSAACSPAFRTACRRRRRHAPRPGRATPSRSIPTSRCRPCSAPTSASRRELDFAPTGFFSGWRLNLDYIYSHYKNPFTIVDLAQAITSDASGCNGLTIDGRPIYRRSICDPGLHGRTGRSGRAAGVHQRHRRLLRHRARRRADADQFGRLQQQHRLVHPVEELRRRHLHAGRSASISRSATPTPTPMTAGTCSTRPQGRTMT